MEIPKAASILFAILTLGQTLAESSKDTPSKWVQEKSIETNKYVSILKVLDSMALKKYDLNLSKAEEARIEKLLKGFGSPEHLFKIAMFTNTIFSPGMAEHQNYDAVYESVFWKCAGLLAEKSDDESVRYLEELKRIFGTDGDYSLTLRELLEKQKAVINEKRN
jgi:hypothetical protein